MFDPKQTIARVVLDHPECASVLQRHRIDFCCRGERTLEQACADRDLDLVALLQELGAAAAARSAEAPADPRAMTTAALVAHIVERHHEYLRQALPFVQILAAKVGRVHGDRNPKLVDLAEAVTELAGALDPHLASEEATLFPTLLGGSPDAELLARELASMHEEHLAVGELLGSIRESSDDFRTPEWACRSYRTLFAELEQLEADVLRHVHLENHVLMPRFV